VTRDLGLSRSETPSRSVIPDLIRDLGRQETPALALGRLRLRWGDEIGEGRSDGAALFLCLLVRVAAFEPTDRSRPNCGLT